MGDLQQSLPNRPELSFEDTAVPPKRANLSRAQVTLDARLIHLGKEVSHPSGVPAFEISLCAPLINGQKCLAHELKLGAGIISPLTRSAIAQIGFELDPQEVQVMGSLIGIEGFALSANGETSDLLMNRIRAMQGQQVVQLGRVGLFPDDSRVNLNKRVRRANDRGRLTSDDMEIGHNASIFLPLGRTSHILSPDKAVDDLLDRILLGRGSGRKALDDVRTIEERPDFLLPGEFLVTEIDIGSQSHHVVLRPQLVDAQGNVTELRHLRAFFLDAGRTQHGIRHAELWNLGKEPIDLRNVRIRADLYRPAEVLKPGH